MSKRPIIDDYITPIKDILNSDASDKNKRLQRLIHKSRELLYRHLYREFGVDEAVAKLLEPKWLSTVESFHLGEWQETSRAIWQRASKTLGDVPIPELVLYPGFGRCNGRVYKLAGRMVIVCSPDFPNTRGENLRVLLAHEYLHFARWRMTGKAADDVPVYAHLYEEGFATWLSRQMLPGCTLATVFMSNLHRKIGLPDPPGGYQAWCRRNVWMIAAEARARANTKERSTLFEGARLAGESTPIRTGYYLGYRQLEILARTMSPRELLLFQPSRHEVLDLLDRIVRKRSS